MIRPHNRQIKKLSAVLARIPKFEGQPILSMHPQPALRLSPEEVLFSIQRQYTSKYLAFREIAQNSLDAHASHLVIDHRFANGETASDATDNGCGMCLEVIERYFLMMFASSKENSTGNVGFFSVGRFSMLALAPLIVEILTLAEGYPGYIVRFDAKCSGSVDEISSEEAARELSTSLGSLVKHGTRVRIVRAMASEAEMVEDVAHVNNTLIETVRFIFTEIKVAEYKARTNQEGYDKSFRIINEPMGVMAPLRSLCWHRELRANQKTWGHAYVGIDHEMNASLPAISFYKGGILLEKCVGYPWNGGSVSFMIDGLKIIVQSFEFTTNIGRNSASLVAEDKGKLGRIFEGIMLPYVDMLAEAVQQDRYLLSEAYEGTLIRVFASTITGAEQHDFRCPTSVYSVKFIPGFFGDRFSLQELDEYSGVIFYSTSMPTIQDITINYRQRGEKSAPFLCLQKTPAAFDNFLKERFQDRLRPNEGGIIIDDDLDDIREQKLDWLARKIVVRLGGGDSRSLPAHNYSIDTDFSIKFGRFRTVGGPDSSKTSHYVCWQGEKIVWLNLNHERISDLVILAEQDDSLRSAIACHFLLREVLFSSNLNLGLREREDMLFADATNRFTCIEEPDLPDANLLELLAGFIEPTGRLHRQALIKSSISGVIDI